MCGLSEEHVGQYSLLVPTGHLHFSGVIHCVLDSPEHYVLAGKLLPSHHLLVSAVDYCDCHFHGREHLQPSYGSVLLHQSWLSGEGIRISLLFLVPHYDWDDGTSGVFGACLPIQLDLSFCFSNFQHGYLAHVLRYHDVRCV